MKTKKFKKELSVAITESILKKNSYFLIELKKENFERAQINFSSTILVKAISKKLNFSNFLVSSTFKFPVILNVFKSANDLNNYLSNTNYKNKISVVFAKFDSICIKFTNFFLLPKLKYLNTFNALDKSLNSTILFLRLLNVSKK